MILKLNFSLLLIFIQRLNTYNLLHLFLLLLFKKYISFHFLFIFTSICYFIVAILISSHFEFLISFLFSIFILLKLKFSRAILLFSASKENLIDLQLKVTLILINFICHFKWKHLILCTHLVK